MVYYIGIVFLGNLVVFIVLLLVWFGYIVGLGVIVGNVVYVIWLG